MPVTTVTPVTPATPVIVTRPLHDAVRWVDALRQRGLAAEALPLINITPATDPRPIHAAWQHLSRYRALMFVSGNAAQHFFALRPLPVPGGAYIETAGKRQGPHDGRVGANVDAKVDANVDLRVDANLGLDFGSNASPAHRCWATGPGTLAALRHAGVPAQAIDTPDVSAGQFDSEALWEIVAPSVQPGDHVLIVRGGAPGGESAGRNWFASQLLSRGAAVDFVVAYERHPPNWSAAQQTRARLAARDGSIWLLSSSEAVGHLGQTLPGTCLANARAVATHPRIAEAARSAGFGVVCESRPTLGDVAASIESLA